MASASPRLFCFPRCMSCVANFSAGTSLATATALSVGEACMANLPAQPWHRAYTAFEWASCLVEGVSEVASDREVSEVASDRKGGWLTVVVWEGPPWCCSPCPLRCLLYMAACFSATRRQLLSPPACFVFVSPSATAHAHITPCGATRLLSRSMFGAGSGGGEVAGSPVGGGWSQTSNAACRVCSWVSDCFFPAGCKSWISSRCACLITSRMVVASVSLVVQRTQAGGCGVLSMALLKTDARPVRHILYATFCCGVVIHAGMLCMYSSECLAGESQNNCQFVAGSN